MSTLTDRARSTRDAILDAARACFSETGFRATTLREVARRARITQPLINHYFGSKDALFDAVLQRAVTDYDAAQVDQWERGSDDVAFFTEGLRVLFWWLGENRKTMRLVMWARLEGRLVDVEGAKPLADKVFAKFADAQRLGIVRDDLDLRATLIVIDAMFKGFWDRSDDKETRAVPELEKRVYRQSMDFLLRGLLTPATLRSLNR
ncbi:MAG: helix-turn-helix domain-containing protein [Myxococcota bacterium]